MTLTEFRLQNELRKFTSLQECLGKLIYTAQASPHLRMCTWPITDTEAASTVSIITHCNVGYATCANARNKRKFHQTNSRQRILFDVAGTASRNRRQRLSCTLLTWKCIDVMVEENMNIGYFRCKKTDSVLCTLEDRAVLQSLWNTTIAILWQSTL